MRHDRTGKTMDGAALSVPARQKPADRGAASFVWDLAMLRTSLESIAFLYHLCRESGDFFVQNG